MPIRLFISFFVKAFLEYSLAFLYLVYTTTLSLAFNRLSKVQIAIYLRLSILVIKSNL